MDTAPAFSSRFIVIPAWGPLALLFVLQEGGLRPSSRFRGPNAVHRNLLPGNFPVFHWFCMGCAVTSSVLDSQMGPRITLPPGTSLCILEFCLLLKSELFPKTRRGCEKIGKYIEI